MAFIVAGILAFPAIIYFTVRGAVEEGTYNALIKYDEYKKENITENK